MTSDNGSGSELPSPSGETVPDQTFLPEMGLVLQIFLMLCLIAVTIVVKPASLKGVLTLKGKFYKGATCHRLFSFQNKGIFRCNLYI